MLDDGVRAMLSVQLFVEGDNLGALNLYGTTTDAVSAADEYAAMARASHAAVAMKGNGVETHLRTALGSRDVIGTGQRHPDGAVQDQRGGSVRSESTKR